MTIDINTQKKIEKLAKEHDYYSGEFFDHVFNAKTVENGRAMHKAEDELDSIREEIYKAGGRKAFKQFLAETDCWEVKYYFRAFMD